MNIVLASLSKLQNTVHCLTSMFHVTSKCRQRNNLLFNKAMLMNIGYIEALEFNDFDCVVFHDVDHLAVNVRNYYGCENMPKHFESGEPKWNWK